MNYWNVLRETVVPSVTTVRDQTENNVWRDNSPVLV